MKWVLLYATLATNGVVATGSAPFANAEACLAAQRVQGTLVRELTSDRQGYTATNSACINTETGEKRSIFTPQP